MEAAAFGTDAEAKLVDALRGLASPWISLVAEVRAGALAGRKGRVRYLAPFDAV